MPVPQPIFQDTKMVRCASEDDDRERRDGSRPKGSAYWNEREAFEANRGYGVPAPRGEGWHPAINVRLSTGAEEYARSPEFAGFEGTAGFFQATIRGYANGDWYVSVLGGDDFSLGRVRLTEKKARSIYGQIRDFVTIRTLRRQLGFREQ